MVLTKSVMSGGLSKGARTMTKQEKMMVKLKEQVKLLKTDKNSVIGLQKKLLENKDKQLQSLQSAVETTVKTTVSERLQSYSAAVAKKSSVPALVHQQR